VVPLQALHITIDTSAHESILLPSHLSNESCLPAGGFPLVFLQALAMLIVVPPELSPATLTFC